MTTTPPPPYAAALDTSSGYASFALAEQATGALVTSLEAVAVGRRSAHLLPRLLEHLEGAGIALSQITHWTVGMGPGSFTGIRLGAALVKGICAGTGATCRGRPSSLAMAHGGSHADTREVAVLHDGRRGELLVSQWRRDDAGGWQSMAEPAAMAIESITAALPATMPCLMLADDRARPELPASLEARLTPLPRLRAEWLLALPEADPHTDAASMEPVYIRPAVFVPPTPPATHPLITRLLRRIGAT